MLENMKFKRKVLSRKKIISSFLVVLVLSLCLGGFMYGLADSFEDFADIRILQIGFLVLFPLFTVIMWVPLCLGGGQIYDMREDALVIIPAYKDRQKWNMILHVLCSDDVTPFLQEIRYEDIDHATFTVDRKAGVWGLSRYTYLLKLYKEKDLFVTLYINPMDNGILLPAGKGGILLTGFRTSEDSEYDAADHGRRYAPGGSTPYPGCDETKGYRNLRLSGKSADQKKILSNRKRHPV